MDKQNIQAVAWKNIERTLKIISPELHRIISALDPPAHYKLYKVKYAFGDLIVDKDIFQLPIDGKLLAITDNQLPKKMKCDLSYNAFNIPIGLSAYNQTETFILSNSQVISLFGMTPVGKIISSKYNLTFDRDLHHHLPYSVSAGSRSIFMLPKIQSKLMHRRLFPEMIEPTPVPKNLFDQWETFKTIANLPDVSKKWHCEILFFSKEWFEHINDPAWELFKYYLLNSSSLIHDFWQQSPIWNLIFSQLDQESMTNHYTSSIVKHVFKIAASATPGFLPTIDLSIAPIDTIQDSYNVKYKLNNYIPTIMCSQLYQNHKPVYYSFNVNTAIEIAAKNRQHNSLALDLFELKRCLNNYLDKISQYNGLYPHSILSKIPDSTDFIFYHYGNQKLQNIASSEELIADDPNFCETAVSYNKKTFAAINPFTRSCIGIRPKK